MVVSSASQGPFKALLPGATSGSKVFLGECTRTMLGKKKGGGSKSETQLDSIPKGGNQ